MSVLKNTHNNMDKALRNTIIAGILLISLSLAFYFVYYLPNKERKLETARQECAEGISKQSAEFSQLYDSENCKQITSSELTKVGNINNESNRIYLDSDEYKQKANCKKYKDNMGYTSQRYDDSFKRCLREKGLVN